jgi:hypothetical protein
MILRLPLDLRSLPFLDLRDRLPRRELDRTVEDPFVLRPVLHISEAQAPR